MAGLLWMSTLDVDIEAMPGCDVPAPSNALHTAVRMQHRGCALVACNGVEAAQQAAVSLHTVSFRGGDVLIAAPTTKIPPHWDETLYGAPTPAVPTTVLYIGTNSSPELQSLICSSRHLSCLDGHACLDADHAHLATKMESQMLKPSAKPASTGASSLHAAAALMHDDSCLFHSSCPGVGPGLVASVRCMTASACAPRTCASPCLRSCMQ